MPPRRDTRWWGWGDPTVEADLPEAAELLLRERGILDGTRPSQAPELDSVSLPEALPLPDGLLDGLAPEAVSFSAEDRLRHATGQSYLDLLARRSGTLDLAPDAVVTPPAEAIPALLERCSRDRVAVVPFGGGTSVVGGVTPLRGECRAIIALDLADLSGCEIDPVSMTARLGAGLRGPEAEALLAAGGFTLGHFPQSFEYATIGGFAATRSSGQSSFGYRRFDELVTGASLVTPAGRLDPGPTPHTSLGPSLRELVLGSEGVLGVIPEVEVMVRPAPAVIRREAWIAPSFEAGFTAVRKLAQDRVGPAVIRVSDETETEVSLASSAPGGLAGKALDAYLGMRGRRDGCLVIVSYEGDREKTRGQRRVTSRTLAREGAIRLGQSGGKGWAKGRFHGPYLREHLMDRGILVETFETATSWDRYRSLYETVSVRVRETLARHGMNGVVMCHLSHAYPDGASLYFTVISSPGPDGGATNWPRVKQAALAAIREGGGTGSHHHATGRDHRDALAFEAGPLGTELLRDLKQQLDPAGVMNPGKLLP